MLGFVLAQIRQRRGRALALGVGVLVSSVAFVLLVGSARSGELKVKGSVQSNFRSAYDVLVRPTGSKTGLESSQGLVRDNYLSGIFGGITLKQWHQIERLPGVSVAAPVANIGYIAARVGVPISLDRYLTKAPDQIFRLRLSDVTPDGSQYPAPTVYVYVTRSGVFNQSETAIKGGRVGQVDHGQLVRPCDGFIPPAPTGGGNPLFPGFASPFAAELFPYISCFSLRSGRPEVLGGYPNRYAPHVQATIEAVFPILLTAIDPTQEAKLVHLNQAVVSGRYLRASERPTTHTSLDPLMNITEGSRYVPVLASTKTYVGDQLKIRVDELKIPKGVDVPKALATGSCAVALDPCPAGELDRPPAGSSYKTGLGFVRSLPFDSVGSGQLGFDAFYRDMLAGSSTVTGAVSPTEYWTVSGVRYDRTASGALAPKTVSNHSAVYESSFGSIGWPLDNEDDQFRKLSERLGSNVFDQSTHVLGTPVLRVVGRFDASKLPGFSPLSRVPMETYTPPLLTAGNAASRKVLDGKPLTPTQNLGDYIQQPPLILTTIASLPAFLNSQDYSGVPVAERRAPISAIRVRVAGVAGADSRSVARIDSVALRIHELTGLDVDVTAGSSPHPMKVALPAGKFGRPALTLIEDWSKKGVSLAFLNGVDRKQLALFALIPLLCCLFLGNGVFAAARARRGEIGALMTLGWGRAAIIKIVLGEILLVGFAAGLAGIGAAAALIELVGLKFSPLEVVLVLPTAVGLALIAGLVPAVRASAGSPLDALRPPVVGGGRSGRIDGLTGMALVNLRRVPGRSILGGLGLAVGACALTVLIAVEQAFNGVLAGSLLGDSISVQIHGFDYLAVGLVIGLAALSVADVLYLNLRERQAELVTLRTFGWQQRHLIQVVLAEALTLGIAASAVGALAGIAIGSTALAAPITPVLEGAAAAFVGGVLAAAAASLLPVSQIGRLTPPSVLAAEQ